MFHILSGYTLSEYIRNRRLTLAASEILRGKTKIIDIALKYGYDTPESFSRAYSHFHGVSPSATKQIGIHLKSLSRLSIKILLEGGSVMDYRIEEKSAFILLSKAERQYTDNVQIPGFWDECSKDGTIDTLRKHSSSPEKSLIGMADGSSYNGESYVYYIGTPFVRIEIPDGFMTKEIPSRTWAIFRCVNLNNQDTNSEMFRKIFAEFFPTSDYTPKDYQLEVFPDDSLQYGNIVSEVWIAVEKK